MHNLHQLLVETQTAYVAADWSLLLEYLQQLILKTDAQHPAIVNNQEYLLKLALAILELGDFQQRWDITKVITRLGNIAIAPLIVILTDEEAEEELRWYAMRTLGEFQHPDAIMPLVAVLKTSDNDELKAMASAALGQMGTLAISALEELLGETETRLLAVRSLCHIRCSETIAPLLSVVNDPQPAIRTAAIEALSSFQDSRIPPILINALDDVAPTVRRAAVLGLGFWLDLGETLDLVTRLESRLDDLNLEVCSAAVLSLSRIGGDAAAQCLFQVLRSPNTPITLQLEIIRALSWIATPVSLAYLQQALNQISSETVLQEIVSVLGRVKKPNLITTATEILLDFLQAKHQFLETNHIKCRIALSLGQLGKAESIEPLMSLLLDADPLVRLHAIAALKYLTPEDTHQQLQSLGPNTTLASNLQQVAAITLGE